MELFAYYHAIRKRLWFIALCCVVAVGVAYGYARLQTPVYQSTTTLALNPAAGDAILPFAASDKPEDIAASYLQYFGTNSFASLVTAQFDPRMTTEEFLKSTSVQFVAGTQFFRISANGPTPELAQRLAKTTAQVLVQQSVYRQNSRQQGLSEGQGQSVAGLVATESSSTQQVLQEQVRRNKEQIASLDSRLADLQAQPKSDDRDRQILNLRQQILDLESLNVRALTAMTEADRISAGGLAGTPGKSVVGAVVVDDASLPVQPVGPSLVRNLLYAFVASLIIGLGGAFFLEYLDLTFSTPDDLERVCGVPVLGLIFDAAQELPRKVSPSHALRSAPASSISESFRMLRANALLAGGGPPPRTLLVTSATPAEGKSTVATNLAVSLARIGKQVVLVDANLRRSSLDREFARLNDVGVTTLARHSAGDPVVFLKETETPGLRLLAAGPSSPSPSEFLGSPRTAMMLDSLTRAADMVIVDGPPVLVVSDALALATRVDGVLLVVQAGKTRHEAVVAAKERLERVGARVLGTVLNRAKVADVPYARFDQSAYFDAHDADGDAQDVEPVAIARRLQPVGHL